MKITATKIPGVALIELNVLRDPRGFFLETFHRRKFQDHGLPGEFVQDNHSFSAARGILRGMHAQLEHPQGKLVRAVIGEVLDVAVDLRPDSPAFGQWVSEVLSQDNFRQLYVPPGCAHGFLVLSDSAHVEYKCTDLYNRPDEIGLAWDDPEVGIEWPQVAPLLNDRDRTWPRLAELRPRLAAYRGLMAKSGTGT
ncbi:MAG TPA: dTDP-4-dehydrorhamnose 3,5-epimerase [Thermoanaerobaculia bacterium]|nr:dTDP-4-dehydrorhamnose 3,5-epimerase [Thermoanaerobaculia bacterium]